MRGVIAATLLLTLVSPALAESARTTCYQSGRDTICETRDQYGNVLSKSRCYHSGRDTICDTRR